MADHEILGWANNFGLNWAQNVLLPEKGIFWENWLIMLQCHKRNPYTRTDN